MKRNRILAAILLVALLLTSTVQSVALPLAASPASSGTETADENGKGNSGKFATEMKIGNGFDKIAARYEKGTPLDLSVDPTKKVMTVVEFESESVMEHWRASGSVLPLRDYALSDEGERLRAEAETVHENFRKAAADAGFEFTYSYSYSLLKNGLAVEMAYGDIDDVTQMTGVSAVRLSQYYSLPTGTASYTSVGGGFKNGTGTVSSSAYDGKGMLVAVIDSALDVSHPAFSGKNLNMAEAKVTAENINGIVRSLDAAYFYFYSGTYEYLAADPNNIGAAANVWKTNKIVYAYDYGNNDTNVLPWTSYLSALDHGTHTTGILGGYATDDEGNVTFSGALPSAQIAFMKVFKETIDGVTSDDTAIAAAIEDAIMLNVDAINMSLGSPCGFATATTSDNMIADLAESAAAVGISVQVAAGNAFSSAYDGVSSDYPLASNPDYGAVSSPASYGYTLAVGSYDGSDKLSYRYFLDFANNHSQYKSFFTDSAAFPDFLSSVGEGTYDWISVTRGQIGDFAGAAGKICIVFPSDEVSVGVQYVNARRAGATAVLFVDSEYRTEPDIKNTVYYSDLPCAFLSRENGERVTENGTVTSGTVVLSTENYGTDLMSIFSAWGCTNALTLKPEIVTVGGNIWSTLITSESYSVWSNTSGFTMDYGYMSGTSMASPLATGYIVMLRQYLASVGIRDAVEQQKIENALLMSTATQLKDINGDVYSPRYQGAGAADLSAALNTPAYLEVVGSEKPKAELGDDPKKTGEYTVDFRIVNVSDRALSYTLGLITMTDSLMPDGKTNALTPHLLDDTVYDVHVTGGTYDGTTGSVGVAAGAVVTVVVKLRISDAAKAYIDGNFENGSYVEGYVTLKGGEGIADLALPYLAFYGDWDKAPIMDKSVYDEEDAVSFASYVLGVLNHGYSADILGYYPYQVPAGYADRDYDAKLVSIGGSIAAGLGAFYRLYSLNYGMLRNAEKIQYSITDAATGAVYTNYTVNQVPRSSYSASYGGMYPVYQKLNFGDGLPSNTEVTVTVKAYFGYENDDENTETVWSFNLFIDDEKPKLYSNDAKVGIENGITYDTETEKYTLTLNVYDNHYLSCIWLVTYDEDGASETLDAPFPVDTSAFRPGERNKIEIDVTSYMDKIRSGNTVGVILEDGTRMKAGFSVPITPFDYVSEEEANAGVQADVIYADDNITIPIGYSTNLGVTTSPKGAKYTLSSNNESVAYVDAEHGVVVGKSEGSATITISSDKYSIQRDVYVYKATEEWSYYVLEAGMTNFSNKDSNIGKAVIKAYYGDGTHVEIPRTVSVYDKATGTNKEVEVCAIDPYAFGNAYLMQYLYIPDTVNFIAHNAFEYCYGLETVEFAENSTLTDIGQFAFSYCYSLKEFFIPKTVTGLATDSFGSCISLRKVTFEEESQMTEIAGLAFSGSGLEEIELPQGITKIGGSAFSNCAKLKKFVAPSSLAEIGGDAFAYCTSLETVDLSAASVKKISSGAFRYDTALRRVYGLSSLTDVAAQLFSGDTELTYVDLPDTVASVGMYAFRGCTKLTEIYLGDACRSIGKEAFYGCYSLRTIRVGAGASLTFGTDALYGCNALENIYVHPDNETHMSDNGIFYTLDETDSKNTTGMKYWYLSLVPSAKKLEEFHLRSDVTVIMDYAFAYHSEMKSFFIPENNSLQVIRSYAFAGCTSLSYINLENAKNAGLGSYVFAYDAALTDITVPSDGIGAGAFYYCVNLKNVNVSDTLTGIGAYAFAYCVSLEGFNGERGLTLPSTLETLYDYAFLYCRSLTFVDFSACSMLTGATGYWGEYAFTNCYGLKDVKFNSNVMRIGQRCFYNCTALETVNFEDCTSMTHIGSYAFGMCTSLKSALLPDSLCVLGSYAFAGCSSLSEVHLSENLGGIYSGAESHQLQTYAFAACTSLTEIELPRNLSRLNAYVFAESGLRSVTIPGNMPRGGVSTLAFYLCTELEEILVDYQTNEESGEYLRDENGNFIENPYYQSIDGVLATKLYQVKSGDVVVSETPAELLIYPAAKHVDTYTIPDGFTTIPTNFFFLAGATRKVVIPSSVTSLADQAFYYADVEEVEFAADSAVDFTSSYGAFMYCSSLRRVILPENITTVSEGTFYECTSLEEVKNTEHVTYFGYNSFYDCKNLREIDVSSAVVIADLAFAYCESLEEVRLGAAATSISLNGDTAFVGCKSLRTVTVAPSNRYYMTVDNVLYNKEGSLLYLYPAGRTDKTFIVPDGVAKVSAYAFAYNESLTSVVLPESLVSVGFGAFYKTPSLSVYVMKSPTVPVLDGMGNGQTGILYYCNFYGLYYEPSDIYLSLLRPAGAQTYDNQWVYRQVFDFVGDVEDMTVLDAETGEERTLDIDITPTVIEVTETGYVVVPAEDEHMTAEEYIRAFRAYAEAAAATLDSSYGADFTALAEAFEAEMSAFEDVFTEAARAALYRMYTAEADRMKKSGSDLYVTKWNRIHDIMNYASYLLSAYAYQSYTPDEDAAATLPETVKEIDFRGDVNVIASSALTVISRCTSAQDVLYWHNVYRAMLDSVPKYGDVDNFWAYRQKVLESILEMSETLSKNKDAYDENAFKYATTSSGTAYSKAQSASCYYMLHDAEVTAENILRNLVKKSEAEAFLTYKETMKAKLDVYHKENYTYASWFNIKQYIDKRKEMIDASYTYQNVYALLEEAVVAIEECPTVLDAEKETAIAGLETAVYYYYDMQHNMSAEAWSAVKALLLEAKESIRSVTVSGVCESVANGYFDEIFAIYRYNRNVWQAHLRAEEKLSSLKAGAEGEKLALILETEKKLSAVSAKNNANYEVILAVMADFDAAYAALQ